MQSKFAMIATAGLSIALALSVAVNVRLAHKGHIRGGIRGQS
jgi:hypothetical protein